MKASKNEKIINMCGCCVFAVPFYGDTGWNTKPNGESITVHCHRDETHIKKGIFRDDKACKEYQQKKT